MFCRKIRVAINAFFGDKFCSEYGVVCQKNDKYEVFCDFEFYIRDFEQNQSRDFLWEQFYKNPNPRLFTTPNKRGEDWQFEHLKYIK